jgi:hypothetical protein
MTLLRAQSNAALAQEVKARLRVRPDISAPLVIFEGSSDVEAYRHFVRTEVQLHAVGGRDRVLSVYDQLSSDAVSNNIVYILDCDNGVDEHYKGITNVVISQNRDMECDLLLTLSALDRLASEEQSMSQVILGAAIEDAVLVGRLKDSGRALGLPVRKQVPGRSGRVRVAMGELDRGALGADSSEADRLEAISKTLSAAVEWTAAERASVLEGSMNGVTAGCEEHGAIACTCDVRRFCNGHDLMELTYLACVEGGLQMDERNFARAIRMGASDLLAQDWAFVRRLRGFEAATGLRVVHPRLG